MPQIKKSAPKITAKQKVEGSKEVFQDLNGLVKENYLIGLDSAHSLLEENKRLMDAQIEQLRKIQNDYTEQFKSVFDKMPKEYSGMGIVDKLDRLIEFQTISTAFVKKYRTIIRKRCSTSARNRPKGPSRHWISTLAPSHPDARSGVTL